MKHTLVVGSAHLDVLSRAKDRSGHRDRIGSTIVEAGGTACNVAFNLRRLDRRVLLMTAWGTGPLDRMMANHYESHGVDLLIDEVPGKSMAVFVGLLTPEGDLESAVSSMWVDEHTFSPESIERALDTSDLVILEANLSSDTITAIAAAAKARGYPVFAMAVSEDKVHRIVPSLPFLTAVFMNGAECEVMLAKLNAGDAADIADASGITLIVTRGERGAMVYQPGESRIRIQPPNLQSIKSLIGVGDAFSVGIIDGVVRHGLSYADAAVHAHALVEEISNRDACNAYSLHALSHMVEELDGTARYDALTGLMQRAAFEREFRRVHEAGGSAFVLIDCDNFKRVNDTHGHNVGDVVLQNVASAIAGSIRKLDVPGRWGGDEFVLALPGITQAGAHIVAERIRNAAAGMPLHGVTLSIGLTMVEHSEPLDDVVRRADQAMYAAKKSGRNAVVMA